MTPPLKTLSTGLALVLALCAMGQGAPASAQTVYVVRHAEKADDSARDPDLSATGAARAIALAETLDEAGLTGAVVTPFVRTRQTAQPSIERFSLTVTEIGLNGGMEGHVAAVVSVIRALPPEAVVLVAGHSNTVPLIVRGLGLDAADMPDCEYDRLTRLDLASGTVTVSRYGPASAC